jgi:predicted transcriptional regulator
VNRYTVRDVVGIELETGGVTAPELLTVEHDRPLRETLGVMSRKSYSQIGVEKSESLIGVVTYHSIVRALRIIDEIDVKDESWRDRSTELAAAEPEFIDKNEGLSKIFDTLATDQYILVEIDGSSLPHIVTDYDVHHFLQESIEPFLLIEEIERSLRGLLTTEFEDKLNEELQEMSEANDNLREISEVKDCSFSHYEIFISKHWPHFEQYFSQNCKFTTRLIKQIGELRNKILHFRVQDGDEIDIDLIRFGHQYLTNLSD